MRDGVVVFWVYFFKWIVQLPLQTEQPCRRYEILQTHTSNISNASTAASEARATRASNSTFISPSLFLLPDLAWSSTAGDLRDMVVSYYSMFLVPCVPFLCTVPFSLYHSLSPIPNTLYRCIRLYQESMCMVGGKSGLSLGNIRRQLK